MKIKYINIIIFSITFFAFSGSLHSDAGNDSVKKIVKLTLEDVKNYALTHSITVRNSSIDLSIAKKKIWETTASGLPQISAEVSYRDQLKIPTTLIPAQFIDPDAEEGTFAEIRFGTQHNASVDLTVNQLIFNGTYIVGLQSAKIYKRISEENLIKSKIDVKALVTQTYDMLIVTRNLLSILDKNHQSLKKLYLETKEMNRVGFVEDTDVDQIKLSLDNLENRRLNMRNQLEITYRLLKFQMGMPLDKDIVINETVERMVKRLLDDKTYSIPFNTQSNIDMKIAATAVKSSTMLMKKEQSSFLPSISAFFTVSGNAMRDQFNFFRKEGGKWYPTIIAGLNLNIPIFSSGLRSSRVQQSRLELKKAVNIKNNVKKGLDLNYKKASSGFINSMNNSKNLIKSSKLAKKIYDKFLLKFKEGISSSMELIQAYNQYLGTEINLMNSLLKLSEAKIELQKLLNKI